VGWTHFFLSKSPYHGMETSTKRFQADDTGAPASRVISSVTVPAEDETSRRSANDRPRTRITLTVRSRRNQKAREERRKKPKNGPAVSLSLSQVRDPRQNH